MDGVGVQSKQRARRFVTKLWVSDCKDNFHPATCLCDNGSDVNLQSKSFLTNDCVFDSSHSATLEGFLDTLSEADNAVVMYQPIWSLRTFRMPSKLKKLSLRMTTSILPK